MPFREAHEAVAQAVRFAEGRGCDLAELKLPDLQQFSPADRQGRLRRAHARRFVEGRSHIGGTAPARVKAAIAKARKSLTP